MINRQLLKLFLIICPHVFSLAQNTSVKVKFNRIEVTSGLSNSNVRCILQDSKGFMWFGTEDGLNKYDGYDFTVYRHIEGDTNSLLHNCIYTVYEDSRKMLWVSTRGGGLHYYDSKLDRFVRIKEFLSDCEIPCILEDNSKNILIAGKKHEQAFVGRFNVESRQWSYHYIFPCRKYIQAILQESENEFWIGIRKTGFFKWNMETNALDSYMPGKNNSNSIIGKDIYKIIEDKKGDIWIGATEGLSKFEIKTRRFTNFITSPSKKSSLLINTVAVADIVIDDNYLWLATHNGGLRRLDTRTNRFTNFVYNKNDLFSISENSVWSVYKDRHGRIWSGTFSKGICVIDKLCDKFSELDIELENNIVNAIWKDKKNRIWIGTEGGVVVTGGKGTKHYKYTGRKGGLSTNPVLSIYEDTKQRMWFGMWEGGINRYDESTDRFVSYLPDEKNPQSLSDPNVYSIRQYSQTGQLLVSSYKGLNILTDEKTGKFETYREPENESNNYIRVIYEDSKKNIWLGTIDELNLFDAKEKNIDRFNTGYYNDTANIRGIITCILEDKKGRLWVSANTGLYLLIDKKIVKKYTVKDGLPNNIVNGILEDDNGNLWLSTTEGLSKFSPDNNTFKNYNVSDGLTGNEFKPGACFKSSDGQFFFGGKGVNVFYPDSIKENLYIPPIYLTDLKLFNQSVKVGGSEDILQQHISQTKEITLSNEDNFFSIHYAALNITISNKNQYAYKLEGFNKDWVYVGNQRSATFTHLDPGTYTFRVKACNNDGLWNEKGTSLLIHVMPPWWKTWWFRILLVLSITGGIFAVFKIKLARERFKNEINLKKQELELKNQSLIIYTMRLAEKGRFISEIKESAHTIRNQLGTEEILAVIKQREFSDNDWEEFTRHFESANPTFFKKILDTAPTLTPHELKLCALLRLNLSSKEISSILRIHTESVIKSRYRIRKKMDIKNEDNLVTYLMNL